ncbi:Putative exporters of the RND superfamily [Mesorhizobium loti]|nr:Putative exporters of the RND superfamily [Mesorhizobium loti]
MKPFGRPDEIDHRNAVSENVMDPSDLVWLRRYDQGMGEKPLVEAVARPEHQPVFAKSHWSPIIIYG